MGGKEFHSIAAQGAFRRTCSTLDKLLGVHRFSGIAWGIHYPDDPSQGGPAVLKLAPGFARRLPRLRRTNDL